MLKKFFCYTEFPKDFIYPVEASCCVCEHNDTILLLKRHPEKWEGNRWNVPGGKVERGETPEQAALRETFEESGLKLSEQNLEYIKTMYIRTDNRDNILHLFRASFDILPQITLREEEAVEFTWKPLQEACRMPLIMGGKEVLQIYKNFILGLRF